MTHLNDTPQPPLESQISGWVLERLHNAMRATHAAESFEVDEDGSAGVHYEASLYGPFTSLFTSIFPTERRFMVKPQGLIRKAYEAEVASNGRSARSDWEFLADLPEGLPQGNATVHNEEPAAPDLACPDWKSKIENTAERMRDTGELPEDYSPQAGDVSLDSVGDIVAGTRKAGTSCNPDFIIVKATASLLDDTILAIVEVKVDEAKLLEGYHQLGQYMDFAASKRRDPELKGFLIVGNVIHVLEFDGPGVDSSWDEVDSYTMDMDRFKEELYDIAGVHWQV